MVLSINTNVSAMNAQQNLAANQAKAQSSVAKLSSGLRITSAKDDSASLAIASGLQLNLASLNSAQQNVAQATSILQITDGGLGQQQSILTQMQSLASQAQSSTLSDTQRAYSNASYQQLLSEIDSIANGTTFNGIQLLGSTATLTGATGDTANPAAGFSGISFDPNHVAAGNEVDFTYDSTSHVLTAQLLSAAGGNVLGSQSINLANLAGDPFAGGGTALAAGDQVDLNFGSLGVDVTLNSAFAPGTDITTALVSTATAGTTAGAGASLTFLVGVQATDTVSINLAGATAQALGLSGSDLTTTANASAASTAISTAVNNLNTARATLGAVMNRLDYASSNVATQIQNTESANSTLMDVDMASEYTNFTNDQVLIQAGVSVLAQANQLPQILLKLLQ